MSDIARDLLEMKRLVRNAEQELAESQGGLKEVKKRLKTQHGLSSLKEARAAMKQKQKRFDELSVKGDHLVKKIETVLEGQE